MRLSSQSLLFASVARLSFHVSALEFGISGRIADSSLSLARRHQHHTSNLTNNKNAFYFANITLGGQNISALIDTGSSDLFVTDPVIPNAIATGVNVSLNFAIGGTQGPIKFAPLSINGFDLPEQAFVQADPAFANGPAPALIGLGPTNGSVIHFSLGLSSAGAPPLDRIFAQNISTPNILTIFLDRSGDPEEPFPGKISISEPVLGLEAVLDQPKLPVTQNAVTQTTEQHWQVLVDEDGVVGPDGKPVAVTTAITTTKNKKQLTAMFDTGFSFSQIQPDIAAAIYGKIPGARFDNDDNLWIVPCAAEVNFTISFGGVAIPIHPLDVTNTSTTLPPDQCFGAFQPIKFDGAPIDIILGMSFLRNAYILINYGDFADGTTSKLDPYIQLLPTTNISSAHIDFVNVRLNGIDTTGSQTLLPTPVSNTIAPPSATPDPVSTTPDSFSTLTNPVSETASTESAKATSGAVASDKSLLGDVSTDHTDECFFQQHKTAIIVTMSLGGALLLLLIAGTLFAVYKSRGAGAKPPTAYRPLHEPAPMTDVEKVHGYSDE
ncbi:acid protease [Auriscalpium vulgare]|uniref:Acid protease n=1 Tax=Auriscalpium vulgare TaxID=40419 RepID=A0ACB8S6J2_9AGAM|nr:acid protease [Auriscalpium vulgare]